jgi:ComF family protein
MRVIHALRALADGLLAVALSPVCAACEQPLERPTAGPVCGACWHSILPITPPLCDQCGGPLPAWRPLAVPFDACVRCRRLKPVVTRARAIGAYDGALRSIIHALKYDGRRSLAVRLGAMMRGRGSDVLSGAHFVVPVPLHSSRRRSRGFNQAADLARELRVPVAAALRRTRATATQTGLPAARRHRNVRDAFAATRAARRVNGRVAVLIDDVCTTGATLEACARVLKDAGTAEVRALTAARVVR